MKADQAVQGPSASQKCPKKSEKSVVDSQVPILKEQVDEKEPYREYVNKKSDALTAQFIDYLIH